VCGHIRKPVQLLYHPLHPQRHSATADLRQSGGAANLLAGASQQTVPLRELERQYIHEVLRQTQGNRSRAAEILGLDRKTLYRKLQEYERLTTE
jgi:DNA-binding NtrC family response regulator